VDCVEGGRKLFEMMCIDATRQSPDGTMCLRIRTRLVRAGWVDYIWRICIAIMETNGIKALQLVSEFKDFAGGTKPYQTRLTDGFLW
jgi:hypothetical protein